MGVLLTDADEYAHPIGTAGNWNESRYIDFWDARQEVGGWFRIGNRPNEGHAEMSACINLPGGRDAFMFARPPIQRNELHAGGQAWQVDSPWNIVRLNYHGDMLLLDDAWILVDPKRAFETSPRAPASIELTTKAFGLQSVMGSDQDHIEKIFLPGQADFHYQHLVHVIGKVRVGEREFTVDGRGAKDHSWGPRNWHAKIYLRWIIGAYDDGNGFVLVRAVGPTKQTRSGHVLRDGKFHVVDDFEMHNEYAGAPHYELRRASIKIKYGNRTWTAAGTPRAWVPLRHRQPGADGKPALLRIVKSPTDWVFEGGQRGAGMCEYHDRIVDGLPVGLKD